MMLVFEVLLNISRLLDRGIAVILSIVYFCAWATIKYPFTELVNDTALKMTLVEKSMVFIFAIVVVISMLRGLYLAITALQLKAVIDRFHGALNKMIVIGLVFATWNIAVLIAFLGYAYMASEILLKTNIYIGIIWIIGHVLIWLVVWLFVPFPKSDVGEVPLLKDAVLNAM